MFAVTDRFWPSIKNPTASGRAVYWLLLLSVAAVAAGMFVGRVSYDWQGLVIVASATGVMALFLIPRLVKPDSDRFLVRVILAGLALKLAASMARLWVANDVYGWTTDVTGYDSRGVLIAQHVWNLEFDQLGPYLQWGTDFASFVTGMVYTIVGHTVSGAFLVFGLLSYLGSYFFYKAFRTSFPDGDVHLFAALVFLFPTILFWANGVGKDAFVFLCSGTMAYGSALLVRGRASGLITLGIGTFGVLWVRPHIAGMLVVALTAALLVRRPDKLRGARWTYVAGLALAAGFIIMLPKLIAFIGIPGLSVEDTITFLRYRQAENVYGGSAFQTVDISNPLNFPMAMVTLLFRPFIWETRNLQGMAQGMESLFVLALVIWRFKGLGKALAALLSEPYLRYALVYIVLFVIFVSSPIGNFGLLARERAMVLPFIFMFAAYAKPRLVKAGKDLSGAVASFGRETRRGAAGGVTP